MGKWRIRLPDGAVWQTTDSIGFGSDPKAGQKIVIKRGTLGNYFLRIDGRNGVRGKRES
jgi:topoisomerase IA-like protein